MKNQGGQGLYRGGENKKAKPTKAEKVFNFFQKERLRILALKPKKNTKTQ